ncbi:MAG TPA: 4-hydroxy-3-methylbut-2-enyl diphosphate reductase [Candidatus Dorea intestinavium]|nr:4-hydroxy-3-methylbut-2-enyl diphosphate reductase [Candidatus Dorea intestinavium]
MKIIRAKSAGFCFGVEKAVSTVYDQIEQHKDEKIYTYGPIIHNLEVQNDLGKKGVEIIKDLESLKKIKEGIVIIRSHGVGEEVYKVLEENKVKYVDATCPFVKRIHKIVKKASDEGDQIVIIGNPEHPEVIGIKNWCEGSIILQKEEEVLNFKVEPSKKITLVAQTTFNHNKFKEFVEIIRKKGYNIDVCNTICSATKDRQEEARKIASEVDAMIVIGDKHSSNTQKLYEICKSECKATYYIQTFNDFDKSQLRSVGTVGITAGASTPNKIIEEVQKGCQI